MHRPQLSALAIVAMVLLCACQRDYSFHTVAVYDAPASRCSVRMEAKGVVRAGADLSDQSTGLLEVHPMAEAGPARAPVTLRVALRQGEVRPGREALSGALTDAGCVPVPTEAEELRSTTFDR